MKNLLIAATIAATTFFSSAAMSEWNLDEAYVNPMGETVPAVLWTNIGSPGASDVQLSLTSNDGEIKACIIPNVDLIVPLDGTIRMNLMGTVIDFGTVDLNSKSCLAPQESSNVMAAAMVNETLTIEVVGYNKNFFTLPESPAGEFMNLFVKLK